jgi:hypothetical protein
MIGCEIAAPGGLLSGHPYPVICALTVFGVPVMTAEGSGGEQDADAFDPDDEDTFGDGEQFPICTATMPEEVAHDPEEDDAGRVGGKPCPVPVPAPPNGQPLKARAPASPIVVKMRFAASVLFESLRDPCLVIQ